jgi:EpsD family peptidyl-prolyl cis-trans isomerase
MTPVRVTVLASTGAAILVLSACGNSSKPPEGQVVATIDGKDVTIRELNAEIAQIPNQGGDAPRKLVESVALARVIERKMLVAEAQKRELDKNPQFLLARQRTDETLLVQALQGDIQQKVTATPRENAQKFVAENPQVFGDRKIFTLDQIQFLRPANIEQLPLKDAKTMSDVEKILVDANIEYRRAPQQLDSLTVNPALTTEIVRLSSVANPEPFMFADQPAGAPAPIIYINSVTNSKTQPFTGERAIAYAQNILQRQEIQKRLGTELKTWQEAYKAKIVYGKGYGPPVFPKAPAAPKAAATAPAATAPAATAPAATANAGNPAAAK